MLTGLALIAVGLAIFYTARANYDEGREYFGRLALVGTVFGLLLGAAAVVAGVLRLI